MKSIRCWDDLSRYGIVPLCGRPHNGTYVVAFIMWPGPGSPRRFAHGVRLEGHITGSESVA